MVAISYKQCTLIMQVPEQRVVKKGRGRKTRVKTVFRWKAVQVMRPTNVGEYPEFTVPNSGLKITRTKVTR